MHTMTKLRPFVNTFLEEASLMFEMYIYTMGDRPYALEMAKLLDHEKKFFDARVISRDDGTQRHQKGLDMILGEESAVLILDDTEQVRESLSVTFVLSTQLPAILDSLHSVYFINLNAQTSASS